jgi:hypothetical protein
MPPVSRIRLRIEERNANSPCHYREVGDHASVTRVIPLLRLSTLAQIVSQTGRPDSRAIRALIDTGAWITALEAQTWRELDRAGMIEHLPQTAIPPPTPALIGGHSSTYRLGRVWVKLVDLLPRRVNWLPAIPVVSQLLENEECRLPAPILFGLHLGVFDDRKLRREPISPQPGPIPENHSSDCGAWFGQEWYLEST